MSVAIIKDGKGVCANGYGIGSIAAEQPFDKNTLFGIASNSQGIHQCRPCNTVKWRQLKWDDKIIDYMPEFRMHDQKDHCN